MPTKKVAVKDQIVLNDVKLRIRSAIEKQFGSVAKFINSEQGKKMGGQKIRVYLYDSGAVSFKTLAKLCEYFGIGTLTRTVEVQRIYRYQLTA